MERKIFQSVRLICLIMFSVWLSGCAATQKADTRRFFWPQLPERPRIEWLKSFSTENDFGAEGGFAKVMSGLVGEIEPISFDKPLDIKSDSMGKVYVSDVGVGKIVVFDT